MLENSAGQHKSGSNRLAPLVKFAFDVSVGTIFNFCWTLWFILAVMGGVIFLVFGVDGLLKGHWLSTILIVISVAMLATLSPQIAKRFGAIEKGLAFFIVAIVSSRALGDLGELERSALMDFLAAVAFGAFVCQLAKQFGVRPR